LLLFQINTIGYAKEYQVGSFFIPELIVDKDKGTLVELYNEIVKRIKENKFQLTIYPPKRAKKMFYNGELDILFPIIQPDKNYPKSDSVYEKKTYIFVMNTVHLIKTTDQLKGKTIGLVAGFKYDEKITNLPDVKYEIIPDNDITGMKMLSLGRLDAFITEEKSGLKAIKSAGITNIQYAPENPVEINNAYFIFQQNNEGELLSRRFSEIIIKLKQEGIYKKIFPED